MINDVPLMRVFGGDSHENFKHEPRRQLIAEQNIDDDFSVRSIGEVCIHACRCEFHTSYIMQLVVPRHRASSGSAIASIYMYLRTPSLPNSIASPLTTDTPTSRLNPQLRWLPRLLRIDWLKSRPMSERLLQVRPLYQLSHR